MNHTEQYKKRLVDLFHRHSMTQQATVDSIARKTGVSIHQTSLGEYLRGEKVPTLQIALAIAQYYNVSIEWMVGETDERTTAKGMAKRLSDLNYSEEAQDVAEILDKLPPTQKTRWVAEVKAYYAEQIEKQKNEETWLRLTKLVALMDDGDGSLQRRIEQMTGVAVRDRELA